MVGSNSSLPPPPASRVPGPSERGEGGWFPLSCLRRERRLGVGANAASDIINPFQNSLTSVFPTANAPSDTSWNRESFTVSEWWAMIPNEGRSQERLPGIRACDA
jgi:hypothetical protein